MSRFSTQAEQILRKAGWYPGRQVPDLVSLWQVSLMASDGFEMFPIAKSVLLEFGGLKIEQRAPGVTYAREPFNFDPPMAAYESDRFDYYERKLNTRMFPLGEAVGAHYFWAIGDNKHVYLIMDDVLLLGKNIDEALESLILGIRPTVIDTF